MCIPHRNLNAIKLGTHNTFYPGKKCGGKTRIAVIVEVGGGAKGVELKNNTIGTDISAD